MKRSHGTSERVFGRVVMGLVIALGVAVAVGSTGCDQSSMLGFSGLYDPSGLIGSSLGYTHDVMDWAAQGWSDVILYDDYIPYDDWVDGGYTYPVY